MKNPILKTLCALLAITSTFGCASSRKLDTAKVNAVKKVAVISVEIQLEMPKDALGFAKVSEIKSGPAVDGPEFQSMAKNVTTLFTKELSSKTGWKVLPLETTMKNPAFSQKVTQSMSGAHAISMTAANTEIVVPKGLLGNAPLRMMSREELVALTKELGADAYAELVIFESIDQGFSIGNLTGNAPFSHKGRASLRVFDLHSPEPIWQIQNVDGETSQNSDSMPEKMTKLEKLAKTGEEAALLSTGKLLQDFDRK